ncbi:hypothetical protein HK102_011804, partial [Quaeritorhiza haematococci]
MTHTPSSEFTYTTTKIHQNFSNYSAWHYRSKVFASAFPEQDEREKAIEDDLELVRNAVWTEPGDQSAWLYQRWLMGRRHVPVDVSMIYLVDLKSEDTIVLVIAFNQPVKTCTSNPVTITLNGSPVPLPNGIEKTEPDSA